MKVGVNAWFLRHPFTGTGAYLRQLLATLPRVAPSRDVTLYTPPGTPAPAGAPYRLRTVALPARLGGNWGKVLFEQVLYARAALADGCDVLHVPHFAPPLAFGERTVVTVHDLIPLMLRQYASGAAAQAYALLAAAAARRSACLLADSKCTARDAVQRLRVPQQRVLVAALAAGPHCRPASEEAIADARRRYGLPERCVLYYGGYDVRKEVATLLRAYREVLAQRPDAPPLVLAGRLPDGDSAALRDPRPLVERLGLTGKVVFCGPFDETDKPAVLGAAECFIFPSLYEGFGLPPLEAMACGTPVVASRGGSLPEVCGDAAAMVPPQDANALASGLLRVLGDEGLRREMRQKGRARASRFTWDDTVAKTVAAYERLGA